MVNLRPTRLEPRLRRPELQMPRTVRPRGGPRAEDFGASGRGAGPGRANSENAE